MRAATVSEVIQLRQVMPAAALDAEAAVLSAVLLDPSKLAAVRTVLGSRQFYADSNRRIFDEILSCAREGKPVDVTIVGERLKAAGRLDQVGGLSYLAQLADATPSVANVVEHAKLVRKTWVIRCITAACQRGAAQGECSDVGDPHEWGRALAHEITCASETPEDPDYQPCAEDPLRGLTSLGPLALVGRERVLGLARQPIAYVWQDIAPPGIITLIAGKPGEGKTTLLFLLLAARANSGGAVELLGRAVEPAPTGQFLVLIEGEHSETSTARKLVRSVGLLGIDDAALGRFIVVARKAVRLGSAEWDDVRRLVRAGLVSDIGIDTIARVAPSDSDSEREQVAIFDGVAQAIEQAPEGVQPPNVWAVAHLRKNGTGGLDDVAGSVQRTGQADTVLMLNAERLDGRVVSTSVVFAKVREEPDNYPEPTEVVVERDSDGFPILRTRPVGAAKRDDRPLEARILDALAKRPLTKSALSKALGRSKQDLESALSTLFAERAIESTDVTISGSTYKGFRARTRARTQGTPDIRAYSTPDEAV
jgi:hypothetical protein